MLFNFWFWGCLAVILCWGVGVYNRITRMRARGLESFGGFALQILECRKLFVEHTSYSDVQAPMLYGGTVNEQATVLGYFLGSLSDLERAVSLCKGCPWQAESLNLVSHHCASVVAAWGQLNAVPKDLAGSMLPDTLVQAWLAHARSLEGSLTGFNECMAEYNQAIGEFPANLLTGFFGFKPVKKVVMFYEA